MNPGTDRDEPLRPYLEHLIDTLRCADHRGIAGASGGDQTVASLQIEELFVEPLLRPERPGRDAPQEERVTANTAGPGRRSSTAPGEEPQPVTLASFLGQTRQAVILAGPGSGKSTLTRVLALRCARGPLAVVDEHRYQQGPAEDLLPIMASIAAYAEARLRDRHLGLPAYLESLVAARTPDPERLSGTLRSRLASGRALVLLDGLDEVGEGSGRVEIIREVDDFLAGHPKIRCLVTSRPHGYTRLCGSIPHFSLAPFGGDQMWTFLRLRERALAQLERPQDPDLNLAASRAQAIFWDIQRHPHVGELARTPLMLVIFSLIRKEQTSLPQQRVQLYEAATRTLIETWNQWRLRDSVAPGRPLPVEHLLTAWSAVALWIRRERPTGLVPRRELEQRLVAILQEHKLDDEQPAQTARSYLDAAANRAGLIEERGAGVFAFWHPTFEEYLSAVALSTPSGQARQRLVPLRADPRYHEIVQLAVGRIGLVLGEAGTASQIVRGLWQADPDPMEGVRQHGLQLAVACVVDRVGVRPIEVEKLLLRVATILAARPYPPFVAAFLGLAPHMDSDHLGEDTLRALDRLCGLEEAEVRRVVACVFSGYTDAQQREIAELARARCEALLGDRYEAVSGWAALGLARTGDFRGPVLTALARGTYDGLRDAIRQLARSPPPGLDAALAALLSSEDPAQRAAAAVLLALGGRADQGVVDTLLALVEGTAMGPFREADAKNLLAEIAAAHESLWRRLFRLGYLKDPQQKGQDSLRTVLRGAGNQERLLRALLACLGQEEMDEEAVRRTLDDLTSLHSGPQGWTASAPRLLLQGLLERDDLGDDPVGKAHMYAARTIGVENPAALRALEGCLRSPDLGVRLSAAERLRDTDKTEQLPAAYHEALLPCLPMEQKQRECAAALLCWGGFNLGRLTDALIEAMEADPPAARLKAAEHIYQLNDTVARRRQEEDYRLERERPGEYTARYSRLTPEQREQMLVTLLRTRAKPERTGFDRGERPPEPLVLHDHGRFLSKLGPLKEPVLRELVVTVDGLSRWGGLCHEFAAHPQMVHWLVSMMQAEQDEVVRERIGDVLESASFVPAAARELTHYLDTDDWKLRLFVAEALNRGVRWERSGEPCTFDLEPVERALRSCLAPELPLSIRFRAAKVLLHELKWHQDKPADDYSPPAGTVEVLQAALREARPSVRFHCMRMLRCMSRLPEDHWIYLRPCLKDPDLCLRLECARHFLAHGKDIPAALEASLSVLDSADEHRLCMEGTGFGWPFGWPAGHPERHHRNAVFLALCQWPQARGGLAQHLLKWWQDSKLTYHRDLLEALTFEQGFVCKKIIEIWVERLGYWRGGWDPRRDHENYLVCLRAALKRGGREGRAAKVALKQRLGVLLAAPQEDHVDAIASVATILWEHGVRDDQVAGALVAVAVHGGYRGEILGGESGPLRPRLTAALLAQLSQTGDLQASITAYGFLEQMLETAQARRVWLDAMLAQEDPYLRYFAARELLAQDRGCQDAVRALLALVEHAGPYHIEAAECLLDHGIEREQCARLLFDAMKATYQHRQHDILKRLIPFDDLREPLNMWLELRLTWARTNELSEWPEAYQWYAKYTRPPPLPRTLFREMVLAIAEGKPAWSRQDAWRKLLAFFPGQAAAPGAEGGEVSFLLGGGTPSPRTKEHASWPEEENLWRRAQGLARELVPPPRLLVEIMADLALPGRAAEVLPAWERLIHQGLVAREDGEILEHLVEQIDRPAAARFACAWWFAVLESSKMTTSINVAEDIVLTMNPVAADTWKHTLPGARGLPLRTVHIPTPRQGWHLELPPSDPAWEDARQALLAALDRLENEDFHRLHVFALAPDSLGAVLGSELQQRFGHHRRICIYQEAQGGWAPWGPAWAEQPPRRETPLLEVTRDPAGPGDVALAVSITHQLQDGEMAEGLRHSGLSVPLRWVRAGTPSQGPDALRSPADVEAAATELQRLLSELADEHRGGQIHLFYSGPLAIMVRACERRHVLAALVVIYERIQAGSGSSFQPASPASPQPARAAAPGIQVVDRPLRFLVLADEWRSHRGGISTFNRMFCRALAQEDQDVRCFIPGTPPEERDAARQAGVTVVDSGEPGLSPEQEFVLRPVLPEGWLPDAVIGHGRVTGRFARSARDRYFCGAAGHPAARLIYVIHTEPWEIEAFKDQTKDEAMLRADDKERIELGLATAADLVVAFGPQLYLGIRDRLHEHLEDVPVHRLDPWLPEDSRQSKGPPPRPKCVFVGRAQDPGLKGLILAAQSVKQLDADQDIKEKPVLRIRGIQPGDADALVERIRQAAGAVRLELRPYSADEEDIAKSIRGATVLLCWRSSKDAEI